MHWLGKAADAGHAAALADLNRLAERYRDLDLLDPKRVQDYRDPLDPELIRFVRMAADGGDLQAAFRLGWYIRRASAKSPVPRQEAAAYLRQAADGGHRAAARMIGMFLAGTDPKPSEPESSCLAYLAKAGLRASDAEHYLRLVADREGVKPIRQSSNIGTWEDAHRPDKLATVELARLLCRTRRAAEAVKYYERALQDPVRGDDYGQWARELVQILHAAGRKAEADQLIHRAYEEEWKWDRLP